MSKYNVGDVVKLRDDLEVGEKYNKVGFHSRMKEMQNIPIKITNIDIDEDYETEYNWYINDEMIEGLWEECKEKQVTMKYKIGDRFRYKDEYNTYRIISCDEEAGKYITVEEKQVGSRVFDVCEEKNMFLERCNNEKNVTTTIFENMNNNDNFPKQPLKLIDVLNMIAKGELKEGTKVIYCETEYELKKANNGATFDLFGEKGKVFFSDNYIGSIRNKVELIEPPCEDEHIVGADKTIEPDKIEELKYKLEELQNPTYNESWLMNCIRENRDKLNEVIRKINKE